jgi:hypothetical protein
MGRIPLLNPLTRQEEELFRLKPPGREPPMKTYLRMRSQKLMIKLKTITIEIEYRARLFQEPYTLESNPSFDVQIVKTAFSRQVRFKFESAIFAIKIKPKIKDVLLLSDLYDALEDALKKPLEEMQEAFAIPGAENQLYITVVDNAIVKGLRTRNFSIKESASKMAQDVIKRLYTYVQSNESASLSNSFSIQIKVLCLNEVQHNITKGTLKPHYVGCWSDSREENRFSTIKVRNIYLFKYPLRL